MKPQDFFRRVEQNIASPPTAYDLEKTVREKNNQRRAIKAPAQKLHVKPSDRWIVRYAGFEFGESYEGNHGVQGSIGSGKSLILLQFLRDVARVCFPGSGNLLVAGDTKGDIVSLLVAESIPHTVISLSVPYGASWDIGADCCHDAALIGALIYALIKDDEKNPFWSNCTKAILTSTARGLDAKQALSVSTLYRATTMRLELLSELFSAHPSNALFQNLLWKAADDKLKGNILAGVAATLEPFTIAAAHDHYASEKVSLTKEIQDGGVIVLRMDMSTISMCLPFYQMLINRLINILTSLPDKRHGSTFLVFDEKPVWKRIDEFPKVMAFGRSKRVHVAYSVQQVKQLESFYSAGEIASIFGNTDHAVYLRSNDPDTEELLSRKFGETITPQVSYSSGYSRSVEYVAKPRLLPGALGRLKAPDPNDGVYFYMDSRYFSSPIPTPFRLPGDWIEANKPKSVLLPETRKPAWMNVVPPMSDEEARDLLAGIPPASIPLPEPKNSFERLIFEELKQYIERLVDDFVVSIGESS